MSPLPKGVWENLSVDFHGPLVVSGEYLMVVIDEFSRYPIVKIVKSIKGEIVMKKLSEIFDIFGIPTEVKTDNGPPFQSSDFSKFLTSMNIKHRKITPLWPQANAICERFMRNLNRVMRSSKITGSNWRTELDLFLRNYRATPHDSTGVAPAELVFKTSRSTCKLANFNRDSKCENSGLELTARMNDQISKDRMKVNMDRKLHSKPHSFKIGDEVLVKWKQTNKSMSIFDPSSFKVSNIEGSMITAERLGKSITRNSSFFRKVVVDTRSTRQLKNKISKPDVEPIMVIQPTVDFSVVEDDLGLEILFDESDHTTVYASSPLYVMVEDDFGLEILFDENNHALVVTEEDEWGLLSFFDNNDHIVEEFGHDSEGEVNREVSLIADESITLIEVSENSHGNLNLRDSLDDSILVNLSESLNGAAVLSDVEDVCLGKGKRVKRKPERYSYDEEIRREELLKRSSEEIREAN